MMARLYYTVSLLVTICILACCATKSGETIQSRKIVISVVSGAANINIYGEALVDWYYTGNDPDKKKRYGSYPAVYRGDTTIDSDFTLESGQEYVYQLRPGEVIFVSALSANGQNAVVLMRGMNTAKEYVLPPLDPYGAKTSFRNY